MRALFITGGSPGAVFDQASLAHAARAAGHEVMMAGPDKVTPAIAQVGLPPLSVSADDKQQFTEEDASGKPEALPEDIHEQMHLVGQWYAKLTEESLPPLLELAGHWRPDVIAGGPVCFAAPLLAHRLGVPWVEQPWGWIDCREYKAGGIAALQPLLKQWGLAELPPPDLLLEVCPPSLAPPGAPPSQPLRWVAGNTYRELEPWMLARSGRRRVLLTSGSRVTSEGTPHTMGVQVLREVAGRLDALGVEVVLAVPDEAAQWLRGELDVPGVRVGWVPMDVIVPTCDLIVHHGGTGTIMTALTCGVPQLFVRELPSLGEMDALFTCGAALELPQDAKAPQDIARACERMLADQAYRERSEVIAREIAGLPSPAEVMGVVEKLVSASKARAGGA